MSEKQLRDKESGSHTLVGGGFPNGKPVEPEPGVALCGGRYVVRRRLGEGGMATVYEADDTHLGRSVALKFPKFSGDPADLGRFHREARAAATLNHPNVCPIFDVGEEAGRPFISMAYIEGRALSDVIESGKRINEKGAVTLVRKLAQALEEAHARGIIHRDIKPSNVMVDRRGRPILMDFGLARSFEEYDDRFTKEGTAAGSPAYMSPEQARAEELGPATDIYSLGIMLYELLAGRPPYSGAGMSVIIKAATEDPPPLADFRPGVTTGVAAACLKAMAKRPADRHASMGEFAAALASCIKSSDTSPVSEPPPPEPPKKRVRRKKKSRQRPGRNVPGWVPVAAVSFAAALLAALGVWALAGSGDDDPPRREDPPPARKNPSPPEKPGWDDDRLGPKKGPGHLGPKKGPLGERLPRKKGRE